MLGGQRRPKLGRVVGGRGGVGAAHSIVAAFTCHVLFLHQALHLLQLSQQHVEVEVDLSHTCLQRLRCPPHDVGGVALQRLDPHVVVHLLLDVRGFGQRLGLFRYPQRVQAGEASQLVQDIRLVVAQVAHRVVAVVWLVQAQRRQRRQPRQVVDLLEVPDAVVGQVQVRQCCERVQSRAHTFHVVTRHEQRGEVRQVGQPAQRREAVVVQEQRLQLLQCVQALHDTDLVGVQVQVPQLRAMLQVLDTLHLTLAHPQLLEVRAVLEAGQLRDHGHLDKADLGEVGEVAHHIATHAEGLECVQACHRVWLVVDLVLRQALRQALHDSATGVSQHSSAHADALVDAPARAAIRPDHPGRALRRFHRLPHVSTWRRLRYVLRHTTRTKVLRGTPATPPSHFVGVLRELAENSRSHQPARA